MGCYSWSTKSQQQQKENVIRCFLSEARLTGHHIEKTTALISMSVVEQAVVVRSGVQVRGLLTYPCAELQCTPLHFCSLGARYCRHHCVATGWLSHRLLTSWHESTRVSAHLSLLSHNTSSNRTFGCGKVPLWKTGSSKKHHRGRRSSNHSALFHPLLFSFRAFVSDLLVSSKCSFVVVFEILHDVETPNTVVQESLLQPRSLHTH